MLFKVCCSQHAAMEAYEQQRLATAFQIRIGDHRDSRGRLQRGEGNWEGKRVFAIRLVQ